MDRTLIFPFSSRFVRFSRFSRQASTALLHFYGMKYKQEIAYFIILLIASIILVVFIYLHYSASYYDYCNYYDYYNCGEYYY